MEVCQRQLQPEWMDDPGLDHAMHMGALNGLRRINAWSRTAAYLWRAITHIASSRNLRNVRILDVASGGGDLAIQLSERAKRTGADWEVDGCDISPAAVEHASAASRQRSGAKCRFFVQDAIGDQLPIGYDIVISTLFLHHLDEVQAIDLLRNMANATTHAVLVDDLLRSRRGYWLAQLGCRALTRSPVVHFDGPVSVLGAYTLTEAHALADQAGLEGARFDKHWPERYLMTWMKST